MNVHVCDTVSEVGVQAADLGAKHIERALSARGHSAIVLATGESQFETLAHLATHDLSWERVTVFHLDEYIGLNSSHKASFVRYLRERFVNVVGTLSDFHAIDGMSEPSGECERLRRLISGVEIDVMFAGIGENAHLAFNDPPADFDATVPFMQVDLDKQCRTQQVNEGWFESLDAVPERAISMTIGQMMASREIVISVPGARKADAVKCAVRGPVNPHCPASILQYHEHCSLYLDKAAAAGLERSTNGQ